MNILNYSRQQLEQMVRDRIIGISVLKQYEICTELSKKAKDQTIIAEDFKCSDRYIRLTMAQHCPECKRK